MTAIKGGRSEDAWSGRFDRQSNKLSNRAVIATALGDFVAVASPARIGVAFDRIEIVLRVAVARNDTGMGELINDDVSRSGLDVRSFNRGIEYLIVIVVAP